MIIPSSMVLPEGTEFKVAKVGTGLYSVTNAYDGDFRYFEDRPLSHLASPKEDAVRSIEVPKEKLVSNFKVLVGDAEELLKATAEQPGDKVAAVRRRIEQSLEEGKKTLTEGAFEVFEELAKK